MKPLDKRYDKELMLYFARRWELDEKLIYKKASEKQMCFVRDQICLCLLHVPCFKVSWHTSKSCLLPVYGFTMRNGIKVICRENFYDWKLSIELPKPLPQDFIPDDILTWNNCDDPNRKDIPDCYLEGFKDEWAWPMYDPKSADQLRFTIEMGNDYDFYMLMYMLNKAFAPDLENINLGSDTRTVEELASVIDSIYDKHGFNDQYAENDECAGKRIMDGDDILEFTWRTIRNCYNKEHEGQYLSSSFMDDSYVVATYLKDHPETMRVFLMEERMFNINLDYDELD
jgi:hypothetical protein